MRKRLVRDRLWPALAVCVLAALYLVRPLGKSLSHSLDSRCRLSEINPAPCREER
jgi:hypothetical protein